MGKPIATTLFEDDYLLRTLGSIAQSADIALTELVANAWDAGASEVRITIPDEHHEELIVADDGSGMTQEHFTTRWMKLGYNRTRHQGREADFPSTRSKWTRMAFGQNGVGRHGLLCFADEYTVETERDGESSRFTIITSSGSEPFAIKNAEFDKSTGHGTRLRTYVERNLPDPRCSLSPISTRSELHCFCQRPLRCTYGTPWPNRQEVN